MYIYKYIYKYVNLRFILKDSNSTKAANQIVPSFTCSFSQ